MIQTDLDARRIAGRLRSALAGPTPQVRDVTVFGDPRRQPGDLVQFTDVVNTGLAGYWRLQQVDHQGDGARYTQRVTVRAAKLTGKWGDGVSKWGRIIWK
jgi:hypothetical protein